MKVKALLLSAVLFILSVAGCTTTPIPAVSPTITATPIISPGASQNPADSVTPNSIVNTAAAFEKAIGKDGSWDVELLNDLTIDKDLVVDGNFKNPKNPPASQRKLAFFTQDDKGNVSARFTVTAPKMTINSPDCAIWHGTFRGDLYVSAKNFQLIDATVDGNIYFTNTEAKSTFKMDTTSKVTGVQQLKTV